MPQQSQPPRTPFGQPSIGELVSRVADNISSLIRGEIDLVKAKGKRMVATMKVAAIFLAVAGVTALYGLGFLLGGVVSLIALNLPLWAAKIIVAGVLLLVAAITGLVGKKKLDAARADVPNPAGAIKDDVDAVKTAVTTGLEKGNRA